MQPVSPRIVACPKCGAEVLWVPESRYRPFCSARCKGLDLGAWASEQYRVEAADTGEDDISLDDAPEER